MIVATVERVRVQPDKIELAMRLVRDWIDNKRSGEIRLHYHEGKVQRIVEEIAH